MIQNLKLFFTHPHARSVGLVFALNSIMFGSWITRLPDIQQRLRITEGELGLALLGLPLGSVSVMPVIGWMINRTGSGRITWLLGLVFCFVSTLPVLAPTYFLFFLAMVIVGLFTGSMDIAMNAAAASVEKNHKITIMSSCHGMWSAGGMLGAGGTALLAGLGVSPVAHITGLAVILLLIMFILSSRLLSVRDEQSATVLFSLPSGPLLGLAIIGFCIMLSEGAVYDWSAVYLRNTLQASPFYSGLGYAGFSLTMALGRFYGDKIIHHWGRRKTVMTGALVAIAGIAGCLLIPQPMFAVAGFTIAGLGYSCLIPAIYITASRMPGRIPGANIAAVASLGYFGLLIGPPLIGIIADYFGLTMALGVVVLLLILIFLLSSRVKM